MMGDDSNGDAHGLDELLGAYALDALDEHERRRVDDYLAVSPRAAAEVAEHREVATMLAFTGMDAPAGVWSRIENEIEAASDAPPPPGPELARVMAFPPPGATDGPESAAGSARRRSSFSPWLLGAAAALVIAVGAVSVFSLRDSGPDDPIAAAYETALADDASLIADLVADGADASARGVIDENGHGYLLADALPPLGDDQTYQLWGVLSETGDVVSIGILGSDPDLETFTIEGGVDALAITIEAAPGVISDGNPDGAYVGALS